MKKLITGVVSLLAVLMIVGTTLSFGGNTGMTSNFWKMSGGDLVPTASNEKISVYDLEVTNAFTLSGVVDGALSMGTATADTGTITMIKGAQTGDPQVQFALSGDANGDFSITADTGDITLTAADDLILSVDGASELTLTGTNLYPSTGDGLALGIVNTNEFSDLFLASGAVINFNNSDFTLTHSSNILTIGGGNIAMGSNSISGIDTLTIAGNTIRSVTATITADTGSAQGGSALTKDYNEISACANVGDSVTLPTAAAGLQITITNHGANSADVFPASSDAINEAAANTAKALAADASMICFAYDVTNWECLTLSR